MYSDIRKSNCWIRFIIINKPNCWIYGIKIFRICFICFVHYLAVLVRFYLFFRRWPSFKVNSSHFSSVKSGRSAVAAVNSADRYVPASIYHASCRAWLIDGARYAIRPAGPGPGLVISYPRSRWHRAVLVPSFGTLLEVWRSCRDRKVNRRFNEPII